MTVSFRFQVPSFKFGKRSEPILSAETWNGNLDSTRVVLCVALDPVATAPLDPDLKLET